MGQAFVFVRYDVGVVPVVVGALFWRGNLLFTGESDTLDPKLFRPTKFVSMCPDTYNL